MSSGLRREGYLLIDNRLGPGVSEEFVRASGKEVPVVGEGRVLESATKTCRHCHSVVVLNPDRMRARGHCRKCDGYICDNPACHLECVPMERVLDVVQENAFRFDNGMTQKALTSDPLTDRLRGFNLLT